MFGGTQNCVQRRARRQADQLLRLVDLPSTGRWPARLCEPVAAIPVGAAGLLADPVLLRPAGRRVLRPDPRAVHRPRAWRLRRGRFAAAASSGSSPSTAIAVWSCRAGVVNYNEQFSDPGLSRTSQGYQTRAVRPAAVQQRHPGAARRGVRAGDDGVPGVRPVGRQHHAPLVRGAPKIGDTLSRQSVDLDLATTCGWPDRACWPSGDAGSRAGAPRRTSATSAATPTCAGTSTSSSSGTTRSSATRSFASRWSRRC